jgi:monoamine oxidase
MMATKTFDVLVVGAGVAGLAAARVCAEAGLTVCVLEAQERVGGRILTVREGDEVIELGAEFVHGRPPELWELIEQAGLATYERTGEFMHAGKRGPDVLEDDDDADAAEGLKGFAGPDCSFMEWVDGQGLSEDEKRAEVGYVEGFNAADARVVSAVALGRQQVAEDAIEGERSWRVVEGYDRVPGFLAERVRAAGGVIELAATVEEVAWGGWGVEVGVEDGRRLKAERCVVALPLGVLLTGDRVRFRPEPARVLEAMKKMRMGEACRVTMIFRKRLWPAGMSFLLARDQEVQVWWTAHPAESLTLTGWIGGPNAMGFLNGDEGRMVEGFLSAIASALHLSHEAVRQEFVSSHAHNWHRDGYSRGAYSYVAVGGLEASAEMSEPLNGRLFFAGEHTDTSGHWGTVHAALRSGLRAGRQVTER